MALREQGELEESKKFLDRALELDARSGAAYFELGRLYNTQDKQADAEFAFGKAVEYSPNDSKYWYAYGEIFRVQQRLDDAIKAYKKSMELDPPFPKATSKLGMVLVQRQQWDDAEQVLIPAIRKNGKDAANYFYLGEVYAAKKQYKRAVENYKRFLEYAAKNDGDRARAKEQIAELSKK
jgi:superkiller protein 3